MVHFAIVALSFHALSLVAAAHTPRSVHARHAALLRARALGSDPLPIPDLPLPVVKKRDSQKCRARPSSSSAAPSHSPIAPVNPASDPNPAPTQVNNNPPPPPPPPTSSDPPQTHSTHKAPPPSTPQPSPTPSPAPPSGGNSGGGDDPFGNFYAGVQTGQLTYYELGLTACGRSYTDADMVCAVSHTLFDAVPGAGVNPNNNPICGKQVKVTYLGVSIVVNVVDRCTACKPTDLDLSPDAFALLAPQALGRLSDAHWEWI